MISWQSCWCCKREEKGRGTESKMGPKTQARKRRKQGEERKNKIER
jgi:hypothetical protein